MEADTANSTGTEIWHGRQLGVSERTGAQNSLVGKLLGGCKSLHSVPCGASRGVQSYSAGLVWYQKQEKS